MAIFEILRFLCLFIVGFQLLIFVPKVLYYVFGPKLGLNVDLTQMGKWAVITGATDGIGKAYVELLAKKGINIILISRNQLKLDAVASTIESIYNVQTKTIAADFTNDDEAYRNIEEQLIEIEIGILINTAGISYSYPEYFLDVDNKDSLFDDIIHCNISSVINMCKIVLPGMIKRRKGVIINVSSFLAQMPAPLITVYSASKAFVKKFTMDLAAEYSRVGIVIQCILPGIVATKISKVRSTSWIIPSPQIYAGSTLRSIGIVENSAGYLPHSLLIVALQIIHSVSSYVEKSITVQFMKTVRSKALAKRITLSGRYK